MAVLKNSSSPSIYLSCNEDFFLSQTLSSPSSSTPTTKWSEEIRYLPMDDGGLIKTKNNLGYLNFLDCNKITNKFIEEANER
jgi:hypothetical protein